MYVRNLIPYMNGMVNYLTEQEEELNNHLKQIEVSPIRFFDDCISVINQQIKTAENKFTMAFVGEFKTGKSTIINSILNLTGDEKLSNEYDPDTAKCIRIMYKEKEIDYEAEIIYEENTYPNEKTDWYTAKKFTSQVALDNDEILKEKAEKISEVRYYIKNDILTVCNILDLPGTGAGGHIEDHTKVTYKKILESDIVFWVVSTCDEPGKDSVSNLERIKNKIIPIINVWQFEKEDIYGPFSADDIKKFISEHYSIYFTDTEEPICYYAKEIEYAQDNNEEVKEEWGKKSFSDCLDKILFYKDEYLEDERTYRVTKNIKDVLSNLEEYLEKTKSDMGEIKEKFKEENAQIKALERKLHLCSGSANQKLIDSSDTIADEIVEYLQKVTDCFIEDQMQKSNLKMLLKSIGRNRKEKLKEELIKRYKDEYLKVNIEHCWYENMVKRYIEEIKALINSEYSRFEIEIQDDIYDIKDIKYKDMDADFINNIIEQNTNAFMQNMGNIINTIIFSIILCLVPGGQIIDAISIGFLGNSKLKEDVIISKKDNIKRRTRADIYMQKHSIFNDLNEKVQQINKNCEKQINDTIMKKQEVNKKNNNNYTETEEIIKNLRKKIKTYQDDFKNNF